MVSAVITVSAATPPPGRKATGTASRAMIATLRAVLTSCVLDQDALEDVGGGLGRVDRPLENREDVLPADHDHRVDPVREQGGDRITVDAISVVLEPMDLDQVPVD